jgi:acetyltransferase
VVALGGRADVDAGDLLDQLGSDPRTRSILLYLETVSSPRKFLSAARAAARNKPVIVVRGGAARDPAADRVVGAAFARAGMLRVQTLQQMFLAAETLARFRANRSQALAILCNGSGSAAMAADAAQRAGVALAALAPATLEPLQPLLAQPAEPAAPLVLDDHAPAEVQVQALRLLQDDPAGAALLLIHAPSVAVSSAQLARAVLPLATQPPPRLLGCWLGDAAVADARRIFGEAGVAHYATPEEAVGAFAMLADYRRNQAQLMEAPPERSPELSPDDGTARALVQRVLGSGRTRLEAEEARELLGAYGIAVVARQEVPAEPYAAASAAERTGYPAALQLQAGTADEPLEPMLRLDLRSAAQVRNAARSLLAAWRRRRSAPPARGFVVLRQPLLLHTRALWLGTRIDPVFGPVILLGPGGERAETAAGLAVALPPLNLPLARALVQRAGVARLLQAQGEVPAADEAALLRLLVAVSQLLIDLAPLRALDLAPLRVGPAGVLVMQADVQLSVAAPAGALNFAIRPYPAHLAETLDWQGQTVTVRPIRPEDEAQHLRFLASLDPQDVRLRVFHTRRGIERSELARLTQIDYAREMALIAVEPDPAGGERTLGVVRAICDPDNARAEFGIVVRSDLKGRRLGELLLRRIIDVQRAHGTGRLVADVLAENARMLELARRLGFSERGNADGTRFIELALQASSPVDGSAAGAASTG